MMKKVNSFILFFLSAVVLTFWSCSDDDEKTKPIVVENQTTLNQSVYADKTEGSSGVSFATTSAWTSSVKAAATRADAAASDTTKWVSLNPSSGTKAGNYTVAIELEPNKTGNDRSAAITIHCDGAEITINVTQKGTKEDGTVLPRTISFKVYSCNMQWTPQNNVPYNMAANAEVKLYKDSVEVGIYKTDATGIARAELEDGNYAYVVTKGDECNINEAGYECVGLFTTQEQIDNLHYGALGFPIIRDMNGDGVINDEDKVGKASLTVSKDETVEVYIASLNYKPVYDEFIPEKMMSRITNAYRSLLPTTYVVDASMTHEVVYYKEFENFTYTADYGIIATLWNNAYTIIMNANLILENIDAESKISDQDKNYFKAEAYYYRMYSYSILLNYFGGVPLYTTSTTDDLPRNTPQEVAQLILSDGSRMANISNNSELAWQVMARVALNQLNFREAYENAKRIVNSGKFNLPASPADWGIDRISEPMHMGLPPLMMKGDQIIPVRYTETMLTYAEAALEMGSSMEALEAINRLRQMIGQDVLYNPTPQQAKEAIIALWKMLLDREGHTFAMLKRTGTFIQVLGSYGAKENHLLLPIPTVALENKKIIQNPGW